MNKKYYITTTAPYVNASPHIGFALEILEADCLARYHRLTGDNVLFNFGTDEHGLKIYRKAVEVKKDPQEFVDEYAKKFDSLKKSLNLTYDNFIRTSDPNHIASAQKFWELCLANGDIYKKKYKVKYCVGCELEKTDSELINGKCEFHPNQNLETIEEENYFFRFSKYQKALLKLYEDHPDFVVPSHRLKEIKSFVENGLNDFSISRLKEKLPWGVPVPNDPEQVMYVWFDALINYISTLSWPKDDKKFKKYWPGVQIAGKDNLRQQSAIWQAMLASAGLPFSKQIFIHGFITINGERISKSLGNVVDPVSLSDKYGTDALRYFLLAKIHPFEDSDFSIEKFESAYNADLANGLGNLVARVAKLCETSGLKFSHKSKYKNIYSKYLDRYRFDQAAEAIWGKIGKLDKYINDRKLWELSGEKLKTSLTFAVNEINQIATDLKPFLPETAEKIEKQFKVPKIKSDKPLFPRC